MNSMYNKHTQNLKVVDYVDKENENNLINIKDGKIQTND